MTTVGADCFARGVRYAQQGAVVYAQWDPSERTLRGMVRGRTGDFYATAAYFSRFGGLPSEFAHMRVWITSQGARKTSRKILALFNLDDAPVTLHATWKQLGIGGGSHSVHSLWDGVAFADSERLNVTLPAHGSTVWRLD